MSEFNDRPFVAGSIRGLRSFRVDQYGRLTGVSFRSAWLPGENVAECRKGQRGSGGFLTFQMTAMLAPLYSAAPTKPKPPPPDNHRPGELLCECGFWAYFDRGDNPYHHKGEGQVYGIVEGYGLVTVGTRGFRAEKSRIDALVIPPKRRTALHDRLPELYPDVAIFPRRTDALDAYPLQAPPAPSPASDPDFWTRETA